MNNPKKQRKILTLSSSNLWKGNSSLAILNRIILFREHPMHHRRVTHVCAYLTAPLFDVTALVRYFSLSPIDQVSTMRLQLC